MAALPLRHFLYAAAERGFAWGEHDCILFAADWVREMTGQDPAAHVRYAYRSADAAKAIVAALGGLEAIVDGALLPLGWRSLRRDGERQAGDIALVDPPLHAEPATGVCVSARHVALLTRRGLVVWPAPVIRAWRHG